MKYLKNFMLKQPLFIILILVTFLSCDESSFYENITVPENPKNLEYMNLIDAREGKQIQTSAPTVDTGNLIPFYEIVSIKKSDGTVLDNSFLQFVTIEQAVSFDIVIPESEARRDQNGDLILLINSVDVSRNGIITIAEGNNFDVDEYSFTIKVTTTSESKEYSTVFNDVFKLTVSPLLPKIMIYSPKNQNLVFGDADSKTIQPIVPNSNPAILFELENHTDKLIIDENTGVVSLSSNYNYIEYDTLHPTINIISKISGEVVRFENTLTTIITDKPEQMPRESIYFFYPTLKTTGSFPQGGDGFSVQVDVAGNGQDIWGERDNSVARSFLAPEERPEANTAQTILETQTFDSGVTAPTSTWMVTETQDLTPFEFGYFLSFNYYYMPAFQTYLADGRTPTDLEVYISTDYTGGDIQNAQGEFLNGTWQKVNENMRCRRSNSAAGTPLGSEFTGTPYPGNQSGADLDDRKRPGTSFYNKWVQCTYDIPLSKISTTFTVAFKVASYFDGELTNKASAPGRGGTYFLSDFNYKAAE